MSDTQDTFDKLFKILELEAQQLKQRAAEIDRKLKLRIIEVRTADRFQQSRTNSQQISQKRSDKQGGS